MHIAGKNKDVMMHGIMISREGSGGSPIIYIDDAYVKKQASARGGSVHNNAMEKFENHINNLWEHL